VWEIVRSRLLVPIVVALTLAVSHAARADEKGDLEKGRNAYLTKDYTEADARFRAMLDPAIGTLKSADLINEARMIWGAVYMAMKRTDDAEALFAKVIRQDPQYQPDPLMFSTEVLDTFTDTKSKLKDEINAQKQQEALEEAARKAREAAERKKQEARIKLLEKLAGQETITYQSSRVFGLMPFGVGQYQNGRPVLGTFFLISEGAFLLASAVLSGVVIALDVQANDFRASNLANETNTKTYDQYLDTARATFFVNLGMAGAFAVLWIASAIEAEVDYVPRVITTKPRPLPTAWLFPVLSTDPGRGALSGGGLSVMGRF